MKEIWIVTAVDTSETADGKARVLQACRTEDEAKAYVANDMEAFVDDAAGTETVMDPEKMSVRVRRPRRGREWNVERVELPA